MSVPIITFSSEGLVKFGLKQKGIFHYQSCPYDLIQDSLRLHQATLNDSGALVVKTGEFTGRSPKDKFTVKDETTENSIFWNEFNIALEEKYFHLIHKKIVDYLEKKPELWIRDGYACADRRYRLNIRAITEHPWTNLFIHNMFLRPQAEELEGFHPEWHLLSAPGLRLDPKECGIRQHNATIVSFKHRTILIAGSGYTGETKKAVFGVLNYLLPTQHNVLSMHCSANQGQQDQKDTVLFFGLSGTGKTTLSTDPNRGLIGDDEHGWTDTGVFNFEGGCYAKIINLSKDKEPDIYQAIKCGAIVENALYYEGTNKINFKDAALTENTRVSYPIDFIPHAVDPSIGAVPKNIFFLTCDAFGVLPPICKLTAGQAMYQFISGYTAKIAGTETGITEPKPTFSACFGAPFMPLHPVHYAEMLGAKIQQHQVHVWLVNTGWTGGPFGIGSRIKLSYTRAMISAALGGELEKVPTETHPVFGFQVPQAIAGIPGDLLNPRNSWKDKKSYDEKAKYLAGLFVQNFEKYRHCVSKEIGEAAPKVF
ncbi:MAG: phosphoenolpyruvate carboxykinase (ATP) [Flavisolibacter sp.]